MIYSEGMVIESMERCCYFSSPTGLCFCGVKEIERPRVKKRDHCFYCAFVYI